jgi:hypothetical protein
MWLIFNNLIKYSIKNNVLIYYITISEARVVEKNKLIMKLQLYRSLLQYRHLLNT